VEQVCGQSAVTSAYAASPLKLLLPRPRGRCVWGYFSNFGGGYLAGDQTEVTVRVGNRARCFLSSQSSTKVYRNPQAIPCGHRLRAELGERAILVLAPDAVQAFAGSRYLQRQEFHLGPGSGLVLVDWVCAGRSARGERWAFTRFQSRNEVFRGPERMLLDSVLLDPTDGALEGPQRLGRFNCLALVLIVGEPFRDQASRCLAETNALPVHCRAPLVCSGSPLGAGLGPGVLLRLAGERWETVAAQVRRHLGFLPEVLGDDPWERKW
jgi:urease accessory protein